MDKSIGRGWKTWKVGVNDDMEVLGLQPECSRICGKASYQGKRLTLAERLSLAERGRS